MSTHRHTPSAKAWNEKYEKQWPGIATSKDYHGKCDANGAHVISAVCRCGAAKYSGGGRQGCPTQWISSAPYDGLQ